MGLSEARSDRHWGAGATLGARRGIWSATGAPLHTWPRSEQAVDVIHKAVYSLVTGWVADRAVRSRLEPRVATTSH